MYSEIVKFRMVIQHLDEAVERVAMVLRMSGFDVYDLRESDIVMNSDGSKISSVYVLCCKGKMRDYERFKRERQLTEIVYEGYVTLM
jgi:hypothetical protein